MSNTSSTPVVPEAINGALSRIDALERQPTAWTVGQIIMWYGNIADIPSSFWPCDGTVAPNGVTTPDLRGRFPVGLKSTDPDFDTLGETGGAKTANLRHNHASPHTHHLGPVVTTVRSGEVKEAGGGGNTDLDTTVNLTHGGSDKVARQRHTHDVEITVDGDTAESITTTTSDALSATQSIMNPYAVVHFLYRWQ